MKLKEIIIIGAGGMGRDVQWLIERINEMSPTWKIKGYLDDNIEAGTIGHDVVMNSYVTLYPGVNVSGCIHIQQGVELGTGSKIIQGKTIGENAIVGAGAVVVTDIKAEYIAVGCPAREIKHV